MGLTLPYALSQIEDYQIGFESVLNTNYPDLKALVIARA